MGPADVSPLPPEAREEFHHIMLNVEDRLALPWQWYTVVVSLPPKATGDDRVIGVLSSCLRMGTATRRGHAASWLESSTGSGDSAVRGSSSLRAAFLRTLRDDTVDELKIKGLVSCDLF